MDQSLCALALPWGPIHPASLTFPASRGHLQKASPFDILSPTSNLSRSRPNPSRNGCVCVSLPSFLTNCIEFEAGHRKSTRDGENDARKGWAISRRGSQKISSIWSRGVGWRATWGGFWRLWDPEGNGLSAGWRETPSSIACLWSPSHPVSFSFLFYLFPLAPPRTLKLMARQVLSVCNRIPYLQV